jgi:hypothetical protein
MTPETPEMLRDLAAEAERQAAEAKSSAIRETMLRVAARLRACALADEDEMRSGQQRPTAA